MSSRAITDSLKKKIAGKQFHKCANKPGSKCTGLEGYQCPLWNKNDDSKGSFDESGYEIDHIIEYCVSLDNSEKNLQALCVACHRVKTIRFNSSKDKNIVTESVNNTNKPLDEKDYQEIIDFVKTYKINSNHIMQFYKIFNKDYTNIIPNEDIKILADYIEPLIQSGISPGILKLYINYDKRYYIEFIGHKKYHSICKVSNPCICCRTKFNEKHLFYIDDYERYKSNPSEYGQFIINENSIINKFNFVAYSEYTCEFFCNKKCSIKVHLNAFYNQ